MAGSKASPYREIDPFLSLFLVAGEIFGKIKDFYKTEYFAVHDLTPNFLLPFLGPEV
ncbi:MAG TPA: hypothetical protein HA261_14460 [Methanosarcina sp.]|nr:hypothetical protein [Methanosarcina sp.]